MLSYNYKGEIMVSLTILSENRDNCEFKGESGLSVLVEVFGKMFLLDTGYSDLFLKNAKLLNIDLSTIETVVLTHGHRRPHKWYSFFRCWENHNYAPRGI